MKSNRILLPFLLLGGLQAPSAPSGPAAPTPAVIGAFFALSVSDVAASARWYSERLGLRVIQKVPHANQVAVTVLEGNGLIVELIQNDSAVPLGTAAPSVRDPMLVHGLIKAGFIVEDFDGTLAMFRKNQVEIAFGPYPSRPNLRANVIVKDNAGNLIQVFGR
jgi:catechol 2,3-dioxygenase-like lactoylglutathione lyase family enzyme